MRPASPIFVLAVAVATVLFAAGAGAQTIYRCGNEYTRIPCPNGRALDAGDPRSAAQRSEARAAFAREKHQSVEMERDRRRNEAATKPALAASLGPVRGPAPAASAATKPASKKKHRKPQASDEHDFIAGVPGSGKKARPASR